MSGNNICPLCGSKGIMIFTKPISKYMRDDLFISKSATVFVCTLETCRNIFHGGINTDNKQ